MRYDDKWTRLAARLQCVSDVDQSQAELRNLAIELGPAAMNDYVCHWLDIGDKGVGTNIGLMACFAVVSALQTVNTITGDLLEELEDE